MRARLCAMLLFLLLPSAALGQYRSRGSLAGEVVNPDGKLVPGARVFIQASDARNPRSTKADSQGRYHFSVRQGNYEVRAHARGLWSEWHHNILVRAGRKTHLTLRLLPKKPRTEKPLAGAQLEDCKPE